MADVAENAYAAGLIDGEGSIYFASGTTVRGEKKFQAFVAVGTCDEVLPNWMHQQYGGSYAAVMAPSKVRPGRKQVWKWQLSGRRNIIAFFDQIGPYLKLKRAQADLMCEFCRLRDDGMSRAVGSRGYTQRELDIVSELKALHA